MSYVHGLYGTHLSKPARRRRRLNLSALLAPLAAVLGHALRLTATAARFLPGLGAGAAFVVGGFVLAPWVGWVVLGAVLLALDRRAARTAEATPS